MVNREKTMRFKKKHHESQNVEKMLLDLPANDFLSPREVASFLSISVRTVYRLYQLGAIQGIGLNQSLRIRRDSLLRYIKNGIGK